jgi:PPOX class probable F420-dependent enzyme
VSGGVVPASHVSLLELPLTAILTTVGADGMPQSSAVWYIWQDDRLLISTKRWAAKFRNVLDRPLAALIVVDPADEFRYVEVRGTVASDEDPSLSIRDRIRAKHGIDSSAPDPAAADRVVLTLTPQHVVIHPV